MALVDAVGIGTGLAIMGIPLALPLASLVFLGAFIPLVGAVVTGFLAVIVALIAKGWIYALITLGLVIAVQQLEGHVLQPLVMGRAVAIHPLAIVLAIAGGGVLAGIVGALLVLFTLIFLLHGGRNIFAFVTKMFPVHVRDRVRDAGRAGFRSLIGYIRATFLVALVDATGIGVGLAVMGVPLALPLASLVFLGAFIPLVGAVLTGGLAVIVALIAKGWVYALITLGLIIAVQQLEAHVLQPLVMGRAVSIHPLAVVLGIAAGGVLAGIVGALLAVPTIAFLNSAIRVLTADDPVAEEQAMEEQDEGLVNAEPDDVEARE